MAVFKCNACQGIYTDVGRNCVIHMHECGPLPPDRDGVETERPDKRSELLAPVRDGFTAPIISEGAGVTCLSNAKLTEPGWITARKKLMEQEEEL